MPPRTFTGFSSTPSRTCRKELNFFSITVLHHIMATSLVTHLTGGCLVDGLDRKARCHGRRSPPISHLLLLVGLCYVWVYWTDEQRGGSAKPITAAAAASATRQMASRVLAEIEICLNICRVTKKPTWKLMNRARFFISSISMSNSVMYLYWLMKCSLNLRNL
jgi:hypothetical protein